MIISKKVEIKVSNLNQKRLVDLGYQCRKGDIIDIGIEHLSKGSKCSIEVKCDICYNDYNISYLNYNRQTNFGENLLYCGKCRSVRSKDTLIDRYGVDNPMRLEEVRKKIKQTNLDKYGVENVFSNDEIKLKIKKTNLEKYGVSHYSNPEKMILTKIEKYGKDYKEIYEKYKKTCLDKYGVESTMFLDKFINNRDKYIIDNKEIIFQKIKQTNLDKYGVENVFSNDEIKLKIKKTNLEKYGSECLFNCKEIINKCKDTLIKNYGVDNPSKSESIQDTKSKRLKLKIINKYDLQDINDDIITSKCPLCSRYYEINKSLFYNRKRLKTIVCTLCFPLNSYSSSGKETTIFNFIKENSEYDIIQSDRSILNGKEIDIYIPELKLGFEFNGLYWHSELYKEKNYHLEKTKSCNDQGISLFHIWEDDWLYKQDIVKSMILNKLGRTENKIFARKCQIKEIGDNKLVRNFLNENHIQGFVGSKIKLGLFYNDELVSLMTFGNLRKSLGQKSQEGCYELLRFCNKLNTTVVGGSSKLFKYFLKIFNVKDIISYSDLSRSNGNMYQQLGFKLSHNSAPNYYYIIDGIRKHRFNFRKDKLIKEGADPIKTEIQIMNERGFYRIFDCGMQKWNFTNTNLRNP